MFRRSKKAKKEFPCINILKQIGEGLIITDEEHKVLLLNPISEKLTGWSNSRALGHDFSEIFPLINYYSNEVLPSPLIQAEIQKKPVGLLNYSALLNRNNEKFFVSANCSPFYDKTGALEGFLVLFRDIDRIKTIEEDAKREKEKLEDIFTSLPIGIVILDADMVMRWSNALFLEILPNSYKPMAIRTASLLDQICKNSYDEHSVQDLDRSETSLRDRIKSSYEKDEEIGDLIIEYEESTGVVNSKKWLKINIIPIHSFGEKQILLAIEDVTQQVDYEENLQKSRDEAQRANAFTTEFVSNMSHEIRTPLNGLIGMIDLLSLTDMDGEQADYISMAKTSADGLLKIIGNILDFSKIEAGKISITKLPFNIHNLMNEIVVINRVLAEQKGLSLRFEYDQDIPAFVTQDADHLRQILNNIIGNAIKFTDLGYVAVSMHKRKLKDKILSMDIVIKDTGVGISSEKIHMMFERFSQADGSMTRKYGGTGLGLSISKQLVELMGGGISVKSEVGRGSEFTISLDYEVNSENSTVLYEKTEMHKINDNGQNKKESASYYINEDIEDILEGQMSLLSDRQVNYGQKDSMNFLESYTQHEQMNRVSLDEEGNIVVNKKQQAVDVQECIQDLNNFKIILHEIGMDKRYMQYEAVFGAVKRIAILMDNEELTNKSFKGEMLCRKQDWNGAAVIAQEIGSIIENI